MFIEKWHTGFHIRLSLLWPVFNSSTFVFTVLSDLASAQQSKQFSYCPCLLGLPKPMLTFFVSFIILYTSTWFLPGHCVTKLRFKIILIFYTQNAWSLHVFLVNSILFNSMRNQDGLRGSHNTENLRIIEWVYQDLIKCCYIRFELGCQSLCH